MSVKYIRLNGDALRQIVENEKHCFRIAMNKQDISGGEMTEAGFLLDAQDAEEERKVIKPPYEKGDILALKETWAMIGDKYVYRLDRDPPQGYLLFNWKPSVQMPNDAARHFIRIIDVRVERLQDISLDDIEREGIGCQVFYRLSLPLLLSGTVVYRRRNDPRSDGSKILLFGFLILTDVFM